MKKIFFILLFVFVSAGMLFAGYSYTKDTTVIVNADGSGSASGVLSNARWSSDTVQYIGCYGTRSATGFYTKCYARNSSNILLQGYSYDIEYYEIFKTISKDTYLDFSVGSSGEISSMSTWNISYNIH
ncbi:MAG: hypothetical protein GY754_01450 [bacterium]|nr:hypothetical protein [bacterium]